MTPTSDESSLLDQLKLLFGTGSILVGNLGTFTRLMGEGAERRRAVAAMLRQLADTIESASPVAVGASPVDTAGADRFHAACSRGPSTAYSLIRSGAFSEGSRA